MIDSSCVLLPSSSGIVKLFFILKGGYRYVVVVVFRVQDGSGINSLDA